MKDKHWVKTILRFASACKGKMIMSVICAVISVFSGLVPYYGVYRIVALFIEGTPTTGAILTWSAVCLGGYFAKLLFHTISTMLSHFSAYAILKGIRNGIVEKLIKAPLGTVLNNTVGRMKNVIIDRVETIELPLAHVIPELTSNVLLPIAVFCILMSIDLRMALAALVTLPIGGIAIKQVTTGFNKKYADYMKAGDHVNSVIVEYTEGIEVIKAFNQSTTSYEKFATSVRSFKAYTLDWFKSTWGLMYFALAVLPSTLLGTVPVGLALYMNGMLTPTAFAMCIMLSLGIITPLIKFMAFVNDTKAIEYAVRDADKLLSIEEMPNETEPVSLKNHSIAFENVNFSYTGKEGEDVLHGINMRIDEGSFFALVGPSGSGKSTVARLIARFWDVGSGRIMIGGVDIRKIPLTQLAKTVSFVTQDNFLFDCSLMENIRLGNPNASDEQVLAAATAACCDGFIRKLEKGYDTPAGEAGSRLSGGEKQRIAIARAILKNAPIVILDEATAFTDPENEAEIQKSIAALTRGKTLLVIAHRLSTITNADEIIILDKGNVVHAERHDKLLRISPLYADMWHAHIRSKQWSASSGQKEAANA